MASSTVTLKFIADLSDFDKKLTAFQARAKASAATFSGAVHSQEPLSRPQARAVAAARGKEQASARLLYEQGNFGEPGSKGAKGQLNRAYAAIRREFSDVEALIPIKDREHYAKTVKQVQAEQLALMTEQKETLLSDVVSEKQASTNAKKAKEQKARADQQRAEAAEAARIEAAKEENFQRESSAEYIELNKAYNRSQRKALAAQKRVEKEVEKRAALDAEGSKATPADKGKQTRRIKAAEAKLAQAKEAEAAAAAAATAKAFNEAKLDSIVGRRDPNVKPLVVDEAPIKKQREKAAKAAAESTSAAEQLAAAEQELAAVEAAGVPKTKKEKQRLAAAQKKVADLTEAAAATIRQEKTEEVKLESTVKEQKRRAVRAEERKAKAAEQEAAAATSGKKPGRKAEDPAEIARRKEAELLARIRANEQLLGTAPADLSKNSYQENLALYAQQKEQMRLFVAEQKEAWRSQARQLQLQNTYGQNLSEAELEASAAASQRAQEIQFAAEAEKAFYRQLGGIRNIKLSDEKDILGLLGEERAIHAARIQIERKAEAEAIQRLGLRDEIVGGRVATRKESALQDAQVAERLAADQQYIDATVQEAAIKKSMAAQEAVAVQETLAADAAYIAATQKAAFQKQEAALAELEFKATNLAFVENEARIAAQSSIIKQQQQNIEVELLLADTAALEEKARGVVLQEQYNRLLRSEVQKQAVEAGLSRGGLLGRLGSGGGGHGGFGGGGRYGIGDGGGLGSFFGHGALTTLKYAVPSFLLFGAIGGITSSIKSAQELEKIMNQIEAQFEAVDKAADFPNFKQSILDIARDSGLAAEAVAEIGFQLQGAFGDNQTIGGNSGQNLVKDQLEASAEISRVTGLSQKEIVDSLTAASFAFDASFRDIGDVTLQLQDRFGVLAKEIIPFLGDIAPVAQQAGFSLEEFATIAAVTQQKSGRSGTALAEAYGRVLPAIQENKEALIQLASVNPVLNTQEFLQAVNNGDAGPIFLALADSFDQMDKSSQDMVISLLGGRREASAIISAFADGDQLMQEIAATSRDNNVLQERYAKLQETLNQQVARLAETFRQFGVDLYEAGLGDALKVLVSSFQTLLGVISTILDLFSGFNDLLGGVPAKLLAILAVVKAIQITMSSGFGQRIGAIPGNISTAVAGAPSLSNAAFNTYRLASDVKYEGLRGPDRALGPKGKIGGSALAQVAAVALAAFSVGKLQETRLDVQGQLDAAGEEVTQRLAASSQEDIDQFLSERDSFMDQVRKDGVVATITPWLTGSSNLQARGVDASQRRDAPRILNALRAFQNLDTPGFAKDEQLLNQTINDFANDPTNDEFYANAAHYLELAADVSQSARNAINEQLGVSQGIIDRQVAADRAAANAIADVDATTQSLEEVKAGFEQGNNSITEVETAYDNLITELQTATGGSLADPKLIQLMNQTISERQKFLSEQVIAANELRGTLAAATGGGSEEQQISNLTNVLNDPRLSDPESRRQVALDIVNLSQELLKKRAEAATSATEALNILREGIQVPNDARAALIVAQLRESFPAQEFISGFSDLARTYLGNIEQQIADVMIATGQAANDAVGTVIDNEIQKLLKLLSYTTLTPNARARILRGLSSLYSQRDALRTQSDFGINPVDNVQGSPDDIAQATADQWQDAADYARDQQQKLEDWRQAAQDIEDARADFFRATIENDPVALARFDQSEADRAFRNATTVADRIRAQAERIRADRQLQEAIQDVYQSQFDLLTAIAEYGGHTVQAAKLGLQSARDKLAYLEASGAGDAEINRAKADVITAQGSLRDARLDRKLSDYQFLYDMDRINKQQYIQYLLQLKQIPDLTKKQLQDLDRQIKQLRDELGADFQFNLPTNIALPTLYEVRRASQTPGGAGAYQDNRNYNIVLYVNNGMDEAQAQQFLADAMGTNRLSTGIRRY